MLNAQKERSSVVFFIFLVVYGVIIINLLSIQLINYQFYTNLGARQYSVSVTTAPPRAQITDINGKPLAFNAETLSAFMVPNQLDEPVKVAQFLAKYFPDAHKRLEQKKQTSFMYIKRKLSDDERIKIESSGLNDICMLSEKCRYYPIPALASIVGITNIDNSGQFGIEALFDSTLRGKPCTYLAKKDARSGRYHFDKQTTAAGENSNSVQLTIDSDLQFLVNEELYERINMYEAEEGQAIILDPTTGNICAMAHYPSFDPNNTNNLSVSNTKNRCLTEAYEFGSVIKVFCALAALEDGKVTLNEIIDCGDARNGIVNGFKVSTWRGHGKIPFKDVIKLSNNIGTAKIGCRVGEPLYDHYRRVGFGERTGINWPAEQSGFITHPRKWSGRSPISLSFGYEIRATLLQLTRALTVICNNGKLVQPKLVCDGQAPHLSEQLYSSESIQALREILENTVTEGTARRARIKGYTVMGKTGTANLITNGKYCETKNIYTFCGIVEKGDYKRIIVVSIKNGNRKNVYASTVTAPLFEVIAEKMLIHDKVV